MKRFAHITFVYAACRSIPKSWSSMSPFIAYSVSRIFNVIKILSCSALNVTCLYHFILKHWQWLGLVKSWHHQKTNFFMTYNYCLYIGYWFNWPNYATSLNLSNISTSWFYKAKLFQHSWLLVPVHALPSCLTHHNSGHLAFFWALLPFPNVEMFEDINIRMLPNLN